MPDFSVTVNKERCKGCGLCIHFCPHDVLVFENEVNIHGYYSAAAPKPDTCKGCLNCYLVCPDMAITIEKKGKG